MTVTNPRTIIGVHSLTFYDRSTLLPFGMAKILGSVNFGLTGSFNDLNGGSQRFPWDSEPGILTGSITGTVREFRNFLFEKMLGATATDNGAEASGNVTTLTNKSGTSVMHATTGIASVAAKAGSEGDLKDGLYVVKVTDAAADKVTVYAMTDADFSQGTDKEILDDENAVSVELVITASTATEVPGFGVELTGGSGTIGMTDGDTAYFYVRKKNTGSSVIVAGKSAQSFGEFGVFIASQKKGNGGLVLAQAYRCKGIGLPMNFSEQAWLNADINLTMLYDSAVDAVFRMQVTEGAA